MLLVGDLLKSETGFVQNSLLPFLQKAKIKKKRSKRKQREAERNKENKKKNTTKSNKKQQRETKRETNISEEKQKTTRAGQRNKQQLSNTRK